MNACSRHMFIAWGMRLTQLTDRWVSWCPSHGVRPRVCIFHSNKVFAIYQIHSGWKTHINTIEPTNSPTQGQPNPRTKWLRVAKMPLFPTANNFSWVGIDFIYQVGNRRQETQPNQIIRKYSHVDSARLFVCAFFTGMFCRSRCSGFATPTSIGAQSTAM